MFTRRNFLKGSGLTLIGCSFSNFFNNIASSREGNLNLSDEDICRGESYAISHEPINDLSYKQLAAADSVVEMLNVGKEGSRFRYDPMLVQVEIGQKVLWKAVTKGHNVEFMVAPGDIKFKSKMHKSAGYIFDIPGIYTYKCTPHVAAGMIGVVVVGGDLSNMEDAVNHKGYYGQSKELIHNILSSI